MKLPTEAAESRSLSTSWRDWRGFIGFIAFLLIFRSAVADWNHVPSSSMLPSILIGDRVIVNKLAYDLRLPFTFIRITQWANPERSDIVTFESPKDGRLMIKRVVGLPGDTISLRDNRLSINGQWAEYKIETNNFLPEQLSRPLSHTRIIRETALGEQRPIMLFKHRPAWVASSFGPVTVPDGHYLMLGDNRDNSGDYRAIGFVPRQAILGRASSVAFSFDVDNYYLPRSNRLMRSLRS